MIKRKDYENKKSEVLITDNEVNAFVDLYSNKGYVYTSDETLVVTDDLDLYLYMLEEEKRTLKDRYSVMKKQELDRINIKIKEAKKFKRKQDASN